MEIFPKDSPSAPEGGAEWSKRGGGEEEGGRRGEGKILLKQSTLLSAEVKT